MLALWWIGRPLEDWLGPVRYLLLYLVSGLAGSAGALIANPTAVTVGASGAIFGILGAAIVLERQQTYVLGGSAITLLVVNLAFTFAVPGISIGGHLGGLAGGALCILALSRFGKRSAAYSRIDAVSIAASSPSACSASRSRTGRCAATPEAATAALETSGLSKTYRGGVAALADSTFGSSRGDLRLPRTERCRQEHDDQAAARPDQADSRQRRLFGLDSRRDGVAARRRIGYLPGDLRLSDRLTAREQLDSLFACAAPRRSRRALRAARGRARPPDPGAVARQPTEDRIVQASCTGPSWPCSTSRRAGSTRSCRRRCRFRETAADGRTVFLSSHSSTRSTRRPRRIIRGPADRRRPSSAARTRARTSRSVRRPRPAESPRSTASTSSSRDARCASPRRGGDGRRRQGCAATAWSTSSPSRPISRRSSSSCTGRPTTPPEILRRGCSTAAGRSSPGRSA